MPATSQISLFVRQGLVARLSDPTDGFNAQLAAVASAYDIEAFQIDFTGADGTFIQGRVTPDQVEQSSAFQQIADANSALGYALMTLDTITESDIGLTLDSVFGGDVQAVIDLTISFENSETIPNFANWSDACLWSVRTCLSNPAYQYKWLSGLDMYNRVWPAQKGPILLAGSNWRQTISFFPKFKLTIH